ncbi:aldo/keto reductase [Rhodococcus sp. MSC1_016]|jgi:D-threo-aldose 1-dehydrogenase|uniref:aldo/keto reductase n=1 Tax=Rhodococcus sp. MSC1_016 TaxID=2909266 RepID=UPI00203007DA|nr:aldo/keto reductase [Rhodococcus sp. MSC1_016]
MTINDTKSLGRSGLELSAMGFGGAPIGNFLRPFTDVAAAAMINQAWDLGTRFFDTAPHYGRGLSEYRLGHSLRRRPREEYVLSTKVGRLVGPWANGLATDASYIDPSPFEAEFDYSYDGVMRSVEQSMQRMFTDHFDLLFIHDCDRFTHGDEQPAVFKQAMNSAYPALEALRDQGVVKAIGFGVNETAVCAAALKNTDADCFLLAGRYTLLEQDPLDELLPSCEERGVGVVLGGVYNSGILATGPVDGAKFNYTTAPRSILAKAAALEKICGNHNVPLPAAALQFAYAHPAVTSICIGARTLDQQQRNADLFETVIAEELWADLRAEGLIREDAPTPQYGDSTQPQEFT